MEFPQYFQQMTRNLADPKSFGNWLTGNWQGFEAVEKPAVPAKALVGPIEAMLHGAEELRHMQLETIHRTQKRATALAKTLGSVHDQLEAVAALQAFAAENMNDAMSYWTAYQQIVRDTELSAVADVAEKTGTEKAAKPARRRVAARSKTARH